MNILEKYGETFNLNDSKKFAELFDDDCVFCDTAPTTVGMDPMYVKGKECIDMMFNMYFNQMQMIAKTEAVNGNVMDYIICYPGLEIPCRGQLVKERDGKILEYRVSPRAV